MLIHSIDFQLRTFWGMEQENIKLNFKISIGCVCVCVNIGNKCKLDTICLQVSEYVALVMIHNRIDAKTTYMHNIVGGAEKNPR